jgi:hypothetical protein
LAKLQEKQISELRQAQAIQINQKDAEKVALQSTIDKLGQQLTALSLNNAELSEQLTDSQNMIGTLKKQLEGNPYVSLPSAPLTQSIASEDLLVKLKLAQTNEASLRQQLDNANSEKILLSERLIITEEALKRSKAQEPQVVKVPVKPSIDPRLKEKIRQIESEFANYRVETKRELETLQNKLLQSRAAVVPSQSNNQEVAQLRTRLNQLVAASSSAKEALTQMQSALRQANQQNANLEAEVLRQKSNNDQLRSQLATASPSEGRSFTENRSLLALDNGTRANPLQEQRVKELEMALQRTQTRLDQREKQFENVVSRMNQLVARLKQGNN